MSPSFEMPHEIAQRRRDAAMELPSAAARLRALLSLTTPGTWEARVLMVVTGREHIVHFGTSNNFSPPRPDECVANALFLATAKNQLHEVLDERDKALGLLRSLVNHSPSELNRFMTEAESFLNSCYPS